MARATSAEAPNHLAARRQAYLAATRKPDGTCTDAHKLLVQARQSLPPVLAASPCRQSLPPDLEPEIDAGYHQILGTALGLSHLPQALDIIDTALTTPENIEAVLTSLIQPPAQTTPKTPAAHAAARQATTPGKIHHRIPTPRPNAPTQHPQMPIHRPTPPPQHAAPA